MKYVRTEYKICQIDKRVALCNIPPWLQTGDEDKFYPDLSKKEEGVFENEILKEADTIEELCDKFMWIKHLDNETYRKFYEKIDTKNKVLIGDDSKLHYQPREELEIYGAIWTDKGLIYVAKMNEKGELELL